MFGIMTFSKIMTHFISVFLPFWKKCGQIVPSVRRTRDQWQLKSAMTDNRRPKGKKNGANSFSWRSISFPKKHRDFIIVGVGEREAHTRGTRRITECIVVDR